MTSHRIALFLPSLHMGGAERVMVNVARGIAERGIGVDIVLASARGSYVVHARQVARVVDLSAARVLSSLPGLARYLRRERPVALISSSAHANVVALWARSVAGVPVRAVVTVHNTRSGSTRNLQNKRSRLLPRLARTFYPRADGVVAVSRGVAEDIAGTIGVPVSRIHIVHNPVVTPELLAQAREAPQHPWFANGAPPVILGAGRLTWEKDFPTLLRAFAVARGMGHVRLMIVGEGPERQRLESLACELGISDDVQLPGFVENPYAYMARAAVFVLSSVSEGLPTVLIEALATGTPVVSTDCRSGPREILRDGEFGTLVPVGDAAALARSIVDRLSKPKAIPSAESWRPFQLETAADHYLRILGCAN